MTASSARKSSACDTLAIPRPQELHLWLCRSDTHGSSDDFLRGILSRYVRVERTGLRISRGPHGKPGLRSPAAPLGFNLSDGGDWRLLAVSGGAAVGVDLEYCDPRRDVLRLARRCFCPTELAQLRTCRGAQRSGRFYDYWTLKEAHVKAFGGSLGQELENISFALHYPDDASAGGGVGAISCLAPALPTPAWYGLSRALDDYRIALCCLAPGDFAAGLRLFELPANGIPVEHAPALSAVSGPAEKTAGVSLW